MRSIKHWLLSSLFAVLFAPAYVSAQTVDVRQLADALKQGGYVIVFRHGATNRDQAARPIYIGSGTAEWARQALRSRDAR
jgi:hypothetical protein